MGKWTTSGFEAYTLSYYQTELQTLFKEAFGDDFLVDETLPQGVLIQRIAELLYNTDMDCVNIYAMLNPNSAYGVWLDLIGTLRGIERTGGTPQLATVTITSLSSNIPYTLASGTTFSCDAGAFELSEATTISSVSQNVSLQYTSDGDSTALVGDTMTCSDSNVNNAEIISLAAGVDMETDYDYRTRQQASYSTLNSSMDLVRSLLYEDTLVKTTGYNYNDTDETVDSLPPHTSEWLAVPNDGVDEDLFKETVGKIIIDNKVPGSQTYGNTSVSVYDLYGTEKTVNFTIPEKIELEIKILVTVPEFKGTVDLTGVSDEKTSIAGYINTLRIGEDVSMSRVLSFIVSDTGYDFVSYEIKDKTSEAWVTNGNFSIGDREYASISASDIYIGG